MRHWRRSRATRPLSDLVSDGYVALFSVVMLGAMLVSVLVNVASLSDELCTSAGCREGRSLLPWVVACGALVVVLSVSRTFGPVFASSAVSSWLLASPVDRGALLRPRVWRAALLAGLTAGLLAAAAATLGGFAAPAIAGFAALTAVTAVCAVGLAVLAQAGDGSAVAALTWGLGLVMWAALLLLALERAPLLPAPAAVPAAGWVAGAAIAVASAAVLMVALRRVGSLGRRHVAAGGSLAPGLSGAMATLDLALTYDVLLGHRWRQRGSVRPQRRGPSGVAALVRTDVARLVRSPQWVLLLGLGVVVPYAVGVAGGERVVFLVGALVGFVAGLPMLVALRVLTRSSSVMRLMPFTVPQARRATMYVPGTVLLLQGLAAVPVLHDVLDVSWPAAVLCGLASGLAALAAGARWVTGRPPDFSRPLVSSPAGGVPTNLYGSVLRGFDILLLATAPVLLVPGANAAGVSVLISLGVLAYLAGRE